MNDLLTFILIHSPLVGPLSWHLVAKNMRQQGFEALVPALQDLPESNQPYWQQHADSVAQSLSNISSNRRLAIVAHSGAGPLLPVLGQAVAQHIAAYVFVDAGIPRNQASRIDLMRLQDKKWADQFYQSLQRGERYPTWQEEDLRQVIPNDSSRQGLVAEITPRALSFFTERIPVFTGWPDAPCAYIKFSSAYEWDFQQAKKAQWLHKEIKAGHFHMLVEPRLVSELIINIVSKMEQG